VLRRYSVKAIDVFLTKRAVKWI